MRFKSPLELGVEEGDRPPAEPSISRPPSDGREPLSIYLTVPGFRAAPTLAAVTGART